MEQNTDLCGHDDKKKDGKESDNANNLIKTVVTAPSFGMNVTNYEDMSKKQLKSIRRGILEAEAAANNIPDPETMITKQLKAVRRQSLIDDKTVAMLLLNSLFLWNTNI